MYVCMYALCMEKGTKWILVDKFWTWEAERCKSNFIFDTTQKISWTDHVRNEEVLLRVKEQRNILHEISKRKSNWIGHIFRRNCLLKRVIEGKIKGVIEVTGTWGRRRKKLLSDLKESRGYSHLKEVALDSTKWRARFERGFGPVVRQTSKWMNYTSFLLDQYVAYCWYFLVQLQLDIIWTYKHLHLKKREIL